MSPLAALETASAANLATTEQTDVARLPTHQPHKVVYNLASISFLIY